MNLVKYAKILKSGQLIFPSDKVYDKALTPIGVAINENNEVGILFESENHPFTKAEVISESCIITTDIIIEPKIINEDTKDKLIETIYLKNLFSAPFDSIEEFEKMFSNEDSILII